MGTTIGYADICKPGSDEGAGPVLSFGLFYGPNYGNLEEIVPREGDTLGILEGSGFDIKL